MVSQEICMSSYVLHTPQATVHSSLVAEAWLAWHSMHRSIMWLRQMAQLSTTMSAESKIPSAPPSTGPQAAVSAVQSRTIGSKRRPNTRDAPQDQSATAFHFLISKRFSSEAPGAARAPSAKPSVFISSAIFSY